MRHGHCCNELTKSSVCLHNSAHSMSLQSHPTNGLKPLIQGDFTLENINFDTLSRRTLPLPTLYTHSIDSASQMPSLVASNDSNLNSHVFFIQSTDNSISATSTAPAFQQPLLYLPSVSCNPPHDDADKLNHLNLHPTSSMNLSNQTTLPSFGSNSANLREFYGVLGSATNNDFSATTIQSNFNDTKSVKIILPPSVDSCQAKHVMHLTNPEQNQMLTDEMLQNTLLTNAGNADLSDNCKFMDNLHDHLLHQKLLGNSLLSVSNTNDLSSLDSQANSSTQSNNYLATSDCASSDRTASSSAAKTVMI